MYPQKSCSDISIHPHQGSNENKSRTKTSVVYEHGARLICLMHHPYSSCAQTSQTCPYRCMYAHEISFRTPDHLFPLMQEGLSTRYLNKNTVLILSHMIPNLLSLLISLAITCSIHTPQVFPSLLYTREKSGISITIATTSSQLHFNTTSVRVSWHD